MNRVEIPLARLSLPVFHSFDVRWMLLAAGDFSAHDYDCMTVSWGGLGVLWGKPCAMVVIRPGRYTRTFMERIGSFTMSLFPETCRKGLNYCGSRSGRDGDKAKAAGFTAIASRSVRAPGFEEAELIIECRKIYFADLDSRNFLDPAIEVFYPERDYHRMYVGEVVSASGTAAYCAPAQPSASS